MPELSSMVVDITPITNEVNLYISQLGLPEENTREFKKMSPEHQENVRFFTKICLVSTMTFASYLKENVISFTDEQAAVYIPIVGNAIAGGISLSSTYHFLHKCLDELEKSALAFLEGLPTKYGSDMDVD